MIQCYNNCHVMNKSHVINVLFPFKTKWRLIHAKTVFHIFHTDLEKTQVLEKNLQQ